MGRKKKKEQLYYPNGEKKSKGIPFLKWLFVITWTPIIILTIVQLFVGDNTPLLAVFKTLGTDGVLIYMAANFVSSCYIGWRCMLAWTNSV